MKKLREEQKRLINLRREHIKLRNLYQSRGKELIEAKRKKRKDVHPSLPGEVEALRAEIQALELKQETQPLSVEEERRVLEEVKRKRAALKDLEEKLKGQSEVVSSIEKMDADIDDYFKKGEEEHLKVVEATKGIDELGKLIKRYIDEISILHNEANKKHELYLKLREKANSYHMKAVEMRQKILALRKEKRLEYQEAKKLMEELKKNVRKELEDEEALQKKREEEFRRLLEKGGKMELL